MGFLTLPALPWLAPLIVALATLMALRVTKNKVYLFIAATGIVAWLANGWLSSGPNLIAQVCTTLAGVALVALGTKRFALKQPSSWWSAGTQIGCGAIMLGITLWMEAAVTGIAASGPLATPLIELGFITLLLSLVGIPWSFRAALKKSRELKGEVAAAAAKAKTVTGKPKATDSADSDKVTT